MPEDGDTRIQQYREAIDLREAVLAIDPTNAECRCNVATDYRQIASILQAQGHPELALKELETALAIFREMAVSNTDWQTKLSETLTQLADLAKDMSDYGAAAGYLQEATAVSRAHTEKLEKQRIRFGELEKGLELPQTLGQLAWYSLLNGNAANALEAAQEALSIAPEEDWIRTNLAHAYLFLGRLAEAEKLYLAGREIRFADKTWAEVIADDFNHLRGAGRSNSGEALWWTQGLTFLGNEFNY